MKRLKQAYYAFMYNITDAIMWVVVDDRDHWARWWDISEGYREKMAAVA